MVERLGDMDEEASDLRPKFSGLHPSFLVPGSLWYEKFWAKCDWGGRKWLDNYVTPYLPIPQLRFRDRSMAALLMEDMRLGFLI